MGSKCITCDDTGRYKDRKEWDVNEGWKYASLLFCTCTAGVKEKRTKHVHLGKEEILKIYHDGFTYEFANGKTKKTK